MTERLTVTVGSGDSFDAGVPIDELAWDFRVQLPTPIDLRGEWKMALLSVNFPKWNLSDYDANNATSVLVSTSISEIQSFFSQSVGFLYKTDPIIPFIESETTMQNLYRQFSWPPENDSRFPITIRPPELQWVPVRSGLRAIREMRVSIIPINVPGGIPRVGGVLSGSPIKGYTTLTFVLEQVAPPR